MKYLLGWSVGSVEERVRPRWALFVIIFFGFFRLMDSLRAIRSLLSVSPARSLGMHPFVQPASQAELVFHVLAPAKVILARNSAQMRV